MRKIIDALAILSFLGTATIIGGGVYVYTQKDAIIDGVKKQVVDAAVDGVSNALPGLLDGAMPALPDTTGGAIPPVPSTPGF